MARKAWTDAQQKEFAKKYRREINMIQKRLDENEAFHRELGESLKLIHGKLDGFNSVRLNGEDKRITFEEALRELYSATKAIRSKKKVSVAVHEWTNNTKLGQILKTKVGKIIGSITIFWVTTSIIHTFGVEQLDPVQLIIGAAKLIFKLFG